MDYYKHSIAYTIYISITKMDQYVPNDVKICENVELKLYQQLKFEQLSGDYNELIELIELFAKDANAIRERELKVRKQEFASHYQPKICEAKRVLKNTEKRIDYNSKRSDYLRS